MYVLSFMFTFMKLAIKCFLFIFTTELIFTTTRYGNPVIIFGKERFNKYWKCNGPKVRWYCTKKMSKGCRASITTIDDKIIRIKQDHSHD